MCALDIILKTSLAPNDYAWLSVDDKARCPVGIIAGVKQSVLCMRLSEQVELADHQFRVAKKHLLIPSVYAALQTDFTQRHGDPKRISTKGPTCVVVRSGSGFLTFETHRNWFSEVPS